MKIHKFEIVVQQGTERKIKTHACGTGCKVSELSTTTNHSKITCKKCLAQINKII